MAVTGRQACLMNSASFKNYFKLCFIINCLGKRTKIIQVGLICLFFLLIIKEIIIKIFLDFDPKKPGPARLSPWQPQP